MTKTLVTMTFHSEKIMTSILLPVREAIAIFNVYRKMYGVEVNMFFEIQ